MKNACGHKNTHLIVLAAVAAFVALLLFLDALVPAVIPDGKERPDRGEDIGSTDGEETRKNWWQSIFDRNEPDVTDGDGEPVPRPTPSPTVQLYYTEREMREWYHDALTESLSELERLEARGGILPISQVGLLNVDAYGTPELIVVHEVNETAREYEVYTLQGLELVTRWNSYGMKEELAVWEGNGGRYVTMFTHYGDGDDRYICELETTDCLRYVERAAMIRDGDTVTYRSEGRRTGEATYEKTVDRLGSEYRALDQTALRLTAWRSNADKKKLAETLLSSGQKFLHTDSTEP